MKIKTSQSTFDDDCSIRVYQFLLCMNIMLGTYCAVDIMFNALLTLKILLQITHSFVKHMRVSSACITDFHLFIVLGDKLLIPCILPHI